MILAVFLPLFSTAIVRADGSSILLPNDPDASLTLGMRVFSSRTLHYRFLHVEPTTLSFGVRILKRAEGCQWLCRWDGLVSMSPEINTFEYQDDDDGNDVAVKDIKGDTVAARRSGVTHASVSSGPMLSGTVGSQMAILDLPHFHIGGFVKHRRSLYTGGVRVNSVKVHALLTRTTAEGASVYGGEVTFDARGLVERYGKVTLCGHITQSGLSIAVPLRQEDLSWQVTPFAVLGYIWVNSRLDLTIKQELIDQLALLGIEKEGIPSGKSFVDDSVTAMLGIRVDVGRAHAFEISGTLVRTNDIRAYMITSSYSLRFDY